MFLDVLDHRVEANLDADVLELALGAGGKIARQVHQDAVGRLDEDDADLGRVDLAEIVAHDETAQFLAGAGELHAGRSAADDDDGHQLLQLFGIVGQLGLFEGDKEFRGECAARR